MNAVLERLTRNRTAPEDSATQDVPAIQDEAAPATAPAAPVPPRRSVARRRLRTLARMREVLLRDLGGLVYEIGARGTPGDRERHDALVREKTARIAALEREAAALAHALDVSPGERVIREPGIGAACLSCGELAGSDARFCARCGAMLGPAEAPVAAPGARARVHAWSATSGSGGAPTPEEPSPPTADARDGANGPSRAPGAGSAEISTQRTSGA